MKVRVFEIKCSYSDPATENIAKSLTDFGLYVEYGLRQKYIVFVVSDKQLNQQQLDEIEKYPPQDHNWSDCEWGDVVAVY